MKFRVSFHITHSSSHWSNEAIVIYYLKKLIFLRFEKRKGLKLEKNAKTLLIFDVFKGQTTSVVNELLQKNDVVVIYVPKTTQTYFYLLIFWLIRVSNAIFLANIKIGTETKVLEQLNRGVDAHDVKGDMRLSTIRSLHAKWIVDMLKFMKESKDLQKISKRSQNLQLLLIFVRIHFSKLNW